jgi:hypothetical protein
MSRLRLIEALVLVCLAGLLTVAVAVDVQRRVDARLDVRDSLPTVSCRYRRPVPAVVAVAQPECLRMRRGGSIVRCGPSGC